MRSAPAQPLCRTALARLVACVGLCLVVAGPIVAEVDPALAKRGIDGLQAVPLAQIADRQISRLGQAALAIRPNEWLHAQTEHFVFHYFQSHVATPVSVEAEFYRRVYAQELRVESLPPGPKAHVFVFDRPVDWDAFRRNASLDPWTGGIHSGNELFVLRDPSYKFKDNGLGHEILHLTIARLYPAPLPLAIEEGLAELLSIRARSSYMRARGYISKPYAPTLAKARMLPLRQLLATRSYPATPEAVEVFYAQSHLLVRFLWGDDPKAFLDLLARLGRGEPLENAIPMAFGTRFTGIDALDAAFQARRVPPGEEG